jgi:hypothetical protein
MKELVDPGVLVEENFRKEITKIPKKSVNLRLSLRRLLLESLNFFFNHDWVFQMIGVVNSYLHLIAGVFLVYPATEEYASAYLYPERIKKLTWTPWPCGVLWQNGKISLMFCITANNGQFAANQDRLRLVVSRVEELQSMLKVPRKTFAGILPGVLYQKRLIKEAPEADLTATAIMRAIDRVKEEEVLCSDIPVIILGGRGFVGDRVYKLLVQKLGISLVHSIDLPRGRRSQSDFPDHLVGKPVIVLNITLKNELIKYVDRLWSGSIVINEVYPEPTSDVLEDLRGRGCVCYHIVGVNGSAIPSFPAAYKGAIPCCAAWPSPQMEVVVRKIN